MLKTILFKNVIVLFLLSIVVGHCWFLFTQQWLCHIVYTIVGRSTNDTRRSELWNVFICVKNLCFYPPILLRYKILNAKGVSPTMTPEQAAKAILESLTTLDPEQYRMGHTKVRLSSLISSSRRLVENYLFLTPWYNHFILKRVPHYRCVSVHIIIL